MPDESCRRCGHELVEYLKCKECNKTTRFVCWFCGNKTNIQYHFNCNTQKENPLKESLVNNSFAITPTLTV